MSLDVQWQCPNCGTEHEHSANVLDNTLIECTECESEVEVDIEVVVNSITLMRTGPENSEEE